MRAVAEFCLHKTCPLYKISIRIEKRTLIAEISCFFATKHAFFCRKHSSYDHMNSFWQANYGRKRNDFAQA